MEQDGGPNTIELEEGSEWRFELENDENIAVRVSVRIQSVGPSRGRVVGQVLLSRYVVWTLVR